MSKPGGSGAASLKKKKVDEETERLVTQILLQRAAALQERAQEDGVLAFCGKAVVRERLNERFLHNTLRGVFSNNRRVDEAALWEARSLQREREERSSSLTPASSPGRRPEPSSQHRDPSTLGQRAPSSQHPDFLPPGQQAQQDNVAATFGRDGGRARDLNRDRDETRERDRDSGRPRERVAGHDRNREQDTDSGRARERHRDSGGAIELRRDRHRASGQDNGRPRERGRDHYGEREYDSGSDGRGREQDRDRTRHQDDGEEKRVKVSSKHRRREKRSPDQLSSRPATDRGERAEQSDRKQSGTVALQSTGQGVPSSPPRRRKHHRQSTRDQDQEGSHQHDPDGMDDRGRSHKREREGVTDRGRSHKLDQERGGEQLRPALKGLKEGDRVGQGEMGKCSLQPDVDDRWDVMEELDEEDILQTEPVLEKLEGSRRQSRRSGHSRRKRGRSRDTEQARDLQRSPSPQLPHSPSIQLPCSPSPQPPRSPAAHRAPAPHQQPVLLSRSPASLHTAPLSPHPLSPPAAQLPGSPSRQSPETAAGTADDTQGPVHSAISHRGDGDGDGPVLIRDSQEGHGGTSTSSDSHSHAENPASSGQPRQMREGDQPSSRTCGDSARRDCGEPPRGREGGGDSEGVESGELSEEGDRGGRAGAEDEEGWVMTEEEMHALLGKYQPKGRGGVGSRVEETGPFLPASARPALEGVARGPKVPNWLTVTGRPAPDPNKALLLPPSLPAQDAALNPALLKLLRKVARRKVKEQLEEKGMDERAKSKKHEKKKDRKKEKEVKERKVKQRRASPDPSL